jgi:hypothetical protein
LPFCRGRDQFPLDVNRGAGTNLLDGLEAWFIQRGVEIEGTLDTPETGTVVYFNKY